MYASRMISLRIVSVKVRVLPSVRVDVPAVVGSAPEVASKLVLDFNHESIVPILRACELEPADLPWLAKRIASMSRLSSLDALAS